MLTAMQLTPGIFQWKGQVRFREADPFGWMFFGSAFDIAHDCFEDFVTHLGIPWRDWFLHPEWGVPVRATEAKYQAPLQVGDKFVVQVSLSHLGESSFTVAFEFLKDQKLCAELSTTHVFISKAGHLKQPIPTQIRRLLEPYLRHGAKSQS